jgi:Ceramidase
MDRREGHTDENHTVKALCIVVDARMPELATCPWSEAHSGLSPGTVHFCEERLCAWVVEPSNAWSSVAYVLVAGWLAARAGTSVRLWAFVAATLLVGVGSFFFHGTGTFAGEFVDQLGMFMLSALVLSFAWGEHKRLSDRIVALIYVMIVIVSSLLLVVIRPIGIPLFAVELNAGFWLQMWMWRRASASERTRYRTFFTGLAMFLVSFCIWLTDITGIVCDPTNHIITGHAIWHAMNAVSMAFLFSFYRAGSARL